MYKYNLPEKRNIHTHTHVTYVNRCFFLWLSELKCNNCTQVCMPPSRKINIHMHVYITCVRKLCLFSTPLSHSLPRSFFPPSPSLPLPPFLSLPPSPPRHLTQQAECLLQPSLPPPAAATHRPAHFAPEEPGEGKIL